MEEGTRKLSEETAPVNTTLESSELEAAPIQQQDVDKSPVDAVSVTAPPTRLRDTKVLVHFKAVGNAPIMKQSKFKISGVEKFITVHTFLRKALKTKPADSLFFYCNSSFAPSPDEFVGDLFKCFNVNNELVINYCTTEAWG
eukprot:GILJ01002948.1.p1 GENE.GILJ01002948.1~~GILJ01002948.1.p1  ORF type:complete len:142 (-),score=28.24 GILJ01002948.1:138-563(-)